MRIFKAALLIALATGCARRPAIQDRQVETRVVVEERLIELPREIHYEFVPCDSAGIVRDFRLTDTTGRTGVQIYNDGNRVVVRVKVDTIQSVKIVRDTTRIVERVESRPVVKAPRRKRPGWHGFAWGVVVGFCGGLFVAAGIGRR